MVLDVDFMFFLFFFQIVDIDVDRCHPIMRRKRIPLTKSRLNQILILWIVLLVSEGESLDSFRRVRLSVHVPVTIIFVRVFGSWLPLLFL